MLNLSSKNVTVHLLALENNVKCYPLSFSHFEYLHFEVCLAPGKLVHSNIYVLFPNTFIGLMKDNSSANNHTVLNEIQLWKSAHSQTIYHNDDHEPSPSCHCASARWDWIVKGSVLSLYVIS